MFQLINQHVNKIYKSWQKNIINIFLLRSAGIFIKNQQNKGQ